MSTVNNMQIQDDEGNVFHPETSIEQIVGENGTEVFPGGKPGNMDSSDMTAAFDEVKMRENIKSGEKDRVLFGKIQKFFADLKTVAFSGKYGDLSERPTLGGAAGYKVADNDTTNNSEFLTTARVAYEHGQEIDALSRDLGGLSFGQDADGNWGYKIGGADTVTPFKKTVNLGTGTRFDVSLYSNHKKFTADNFIIKIERVTTFQSPTDSDRDNGNAGVNISPTVSYDAEKGIVTVSGLEGIGRFKTYGSTGCIIKSKVEASVWLIF